MTVSATSYEALAVKYAIDMLAASSTFQTLTSTASATLAKAKIIESYGGNANEATAGGKGYATDGTAFTLTAPYAIVHSQGQDTERIGVGIYGYSGTIEVEIVMARVVSGEKPPEIFRRARNVGGDIRLNILALYGTAGYLAQGDVDIEGPMLLDDTGADRGDVLVRLLLHWEG